MSSGIDYGDKRLEQDDCREITREPIWRLPKVTKGTELWLSSGIDYDQETPDLDDCQEITTRVLHSHCLRFFNGASARLRMSSDGF